MKNLLRCKDCTCIYRTMTSWLCEAPRRPLKWVNPGWFACKNVVPRKKH